jgi:glucosamine--fructose-6-phosphate aminotransferase (isomerizing)
MNPDGFLEDILAEPATLAHVLERHDAPDGPLAALTAKIAAARLVVFLGMGSSRFAALTAAAALRARGVAAVAEYASTDAPTAPGAGVVAVGISASGGSEETVEALARHHGTSATVAITNAPDGGRLAGVADRLVPLHAGEERGGVACKTFQATLAVLLRATGVPTSALAPAVDVQAALLDARGAWLDELVALLDIEPRNAYMIAPAARISSALQAALMFREGPRIAADSAETGDWLHVDVYLSKYPNYRALLFGGSRYDEGVMAWARERASSIVAVGRAIEGAALHIPFAHSDDPLICALVEVSVAELAAATWWQRRVAADLMP